MKVLMLSLMILFISSNSVSSELTISITNGEWEPYLSEYSYQYGVVSQIVAEAFRVEDISVRWGFFPWKRSYELAKQGHWDASAVWWPREETRKDFWVSDPVIETSFVYFYMKNKTFDWEKIEDLKGLNIGITLSYDYGKEFMAAMQKGGILVDTSAQDELNYKKLLLGRIDIFPNDPIVGYAQIKNTFEPEQVKLFTHHPKVFEQSTLSLIISKQTEQGRFFLEKFNSGLKKLKQSGRLEQLFQDMHAGKYDKQKLKWREQEYGQILLETAAP